MDKEQRWRELEAAWQRVRDYFIEKDISIGLATYVNASELVALRRTFGYAYPKNMAGVK